MALSYSSSGIAGLAADVKPTNVPDGTLFFETDTGSFLLFRSSAWASAALLSAKQAPGSFTINAGSFFHMPEGIELGAGEGVTIDAGGQLVIGL